MYYMQSVINSVKTVLGSHVNIHGCFYHLTQSTRQKIQKLGLSTVYRDDDDVKHWCGMLDALAFLPLADVAEGMSYTRANMPMGDGLESLADLVDYFDATYVSGSARRVVRPASRFSSCKSRSG